MSNMTFKANLLPQTDYGFELGSIENPSDPKRWKIYGAVNGAKIFHGTCSTAAGTTAKEVVCPEFLESDLTTGTIIFVTFTVTNSGAVGSLTMSVNSTTAKPIKYYHNNAASNLPGVGYLSAGNTYMFWYDGTNWKTLMDYDTNTNDASQMYIRFNNGTFVPSTALYRYQILLTKDETTLIPTNTTSNSTATTKVLTTESFNPFAPIYYYSTTGTVNAGAAIGVGNLWCARNNADLRYAFNTGSTLVANKDVYLVADMQDGLMAKLCTTVGPIVQTLPTTEDGHIYIKLGHAASTTAVSMTYDHPIYQYKNGSLQPYAPIPSIASMGGISSVTATGTAPLTLTATSSGTAITITGSIAAATTSTAGIMAMSQTNLNTMINQLGTGTSTPVDADYYISQFVNGGSTTTTYHRRPMSALYDYVKGKLSVTNNNINLTRNTETTIATIGGTAIKIKLPASDNTDTKQNITLASTSKAYITGVTTTPTSTAQALTGVADTGVYLTATAGEISAVRHSYNISGTEKAYITFNTTTNALDFVFAS